MDMINNFIGLTLQLSVPIILGALCGTIAERGGIILLGVEGIMLIGAFAGAAGSYAAGSAMAGVLLSVVLGGMIGWFYALFCLKWKAHQSVVGVGINLFASGITAVMLKAIWQTEGMSESVPSISNLTIPGLSGIPVIGALFKDQSPYLYAMFLIVAAVWIVFYKTKFGGVFVGIQFNQLIACRLVPRYIGNYMAYIHFPWSHVCSPPDFFLLTCCNPAVFQLAQLLIL